MDQEQDYAAAATSKQELMQRIEYEWNALQRAVAGRSEAQLTKPDAGGWSVKDNLAHLAAWEQFMLHAYLRGEPSHTAMGLDAEAMKDASEDQINDLVWRKYQGLSLQEVLAESQRSHQEIISDLENRTWDSLMQPLRATDPQKRPVLNWVGGNTYEHYQEHRRYVERALG